MLRHYLPSIAAIIALLLAMLIVPIGGELVSDKGTSLKTSTVLAQNPPPTEVIFEIKLFDPTEKTIKLPNPYEFARPAEIRSVHSIYCCFSGNIKLYLEDILVNEQQKTLHSCERCGNDSEAVDWVIPPGTIADKIEQPGAIAEGDVKFIDILGRRTDTVSVNDLAKTIDRVSNIASTVGVQKVAISSSNPEVIVWMGRPDDYFKKETTVFTDNVYACSDLDLNGKCDFLSIACNDQSDNDGDGKIDFPNDPGCESLIDNDETDPPACRDTIDNDGDAKIDFPHDPGCTDANDTDETDPPVEKVISLKKNAKPAVTIMPLLADREILKFQTTCATCTIQTSQDPQNFIGGTAAANAGFVMIATLLDTSSNTYSHTIVAVGEFEQQTKLFNAAGQEYIGLGEDPTNQYPIGVLANAQNDIYVRTRINNQFEQVEMSSLMLPSSASVSLTNGSTHYYLFIGEGSNGKGYLVIARGRHWDTGTLSNTSITPEPFYSFFLGKGTLSQCIQSLQNYPKKESLLANINSYQLLLELLNLCQR